MLGASGKTPTLSVQFQNQTNFVGGAGVVANVSLKKTNAENQDSWILITSAWGFAVFVAVFILLFGCIAFFVYWGVFVVCVFCVCL